MLFAIASGVCLIGASFWWGGPAGQLRGPLYLAAIVVPMLIGVGNWVALAVLLVKTFRQWRT